MKKSMIEKIINKLCTTTYDESTGKKYYTFSGSQLFIQGVIAAGSFMISKYAGSCLSNAFNKVNKKTKTQTTDK